MTVAVTLLGWYASVSNASAQNIFRVRFDTVVARAGDLVTVNVLYTFTSTHAHSIRDLTLRFVTDSLEIRPVAYLTQGTATANLPDTLWSHTGFHGDGTSEIDISNPVLIRVQFRVDPRLSDTAFLRWDRAFPMFEPNDGVDSEVQQDGWIRTDSAKGHVVIQTSGQTIVGETQGYSPDSIRSQVPVTISNITRANMKDALLTFSIDSSRIAFDSVASASGATVTGIDRTPLVGGREQIDIRLHSASPIIGGASAIVLQFVGLIGLDTVNESIDKVRMLPLNADGWIGNTVYIGRPIVLEGHLPSGAVRERSVVKQIAIYPNPARERVTFEGIEEGSEAMIYDALGRIVAESNEAVWNVPPGFSAGAYEVVLATKSGERWWGQMTIVP